jgi:uncharacterized protein with PQ loop repeat
MKEQKNKLESLTWIAGIIVIFSFSDLVYNVYLTKNTSSLTFIWIFLVIASQLLYFIFGLVNHIEGIYITSTFILLMISYIFYEKYFSIKNT